MKRSNIRHSKLCLVLYVKIDNFSSVVQHELLNSTYTEENLEKILNAGDGAGNESAEKQQLTLVRTHTADLPVPPNGSDVTPTTSDRADKLKRL
ncbi:hypothetical protein PR048_016395 [Dryococelus australis]|uniref:Uncharacterized protein n=1 Tax=Dryococelus australis TaxID=614101 RepID=A0ABQ9HJM5_9NEOP|nr:hypothetical protein PR048_016395 [Dryococelus australis]